MIIQTKCGICDRDPAGRWVQPAAIVFIDNYRKDGGSKYRCRAHVSAKREAEIRASERDRGFPFR